MIETERHRLSQTGKSPDKPIGPQLKNYPEGLICHADFIITGGGSIPKQSATNPIGLFS